MDPITKQSPIDLMTQAFKSGQRVHVDINGNSYEVCIVTTKKEGSSLDEITKSIDSLVTSSPSQKALGELNKAILQRANQLENKRPKGIRKFFAWLSGGLRKFDDAVSKMQQLAAKVFSIQNKQTLLDKAKKNSITTNEIDSYYLIYKEDEKALEQMAKALRDSNEKAHFHQLSGYIEQRD